MEKKDRKVQKRDQDTFYETFRVASTTECTGLMPSLPETEDEDENYAALYATHKSPQQGRVPGIEVDK